MHAICDHVGDDDHIAWAVVGGGAVYFTADDRDDCEAWLDENAGGGCWDILALHWCPECEEYSTWDTAADRAILARRAASAAAVNPPAAPPPAGR